MNTERDSLFTTVAVYSNHSAAEGAIEVLERAGYPLANLSIVGRDYESSERPIGVLRTSDVAGRGAAVGTAAGGLFGLLFGAAFLILPGIGPVIVAGPFLAALLGGAEGAVAGAALGGLSGALVGLGVSKAHVMRYESELHAGKFLVMLRADEAVAARARGLLATRDAESSETFHSPSPPSSASTSEPLDVRPHV